MTWLTQQTPLLVLTTAGMMIGLGLGCQDETTTEGPTSSTSSSSGSSSSSTSGQAGGGGSSSSGTGGAGGSSSSGTGGAGGSSSSGTGGSGGSGGSTGGSGGSGGSAGGSGGSGGNTGGAGGTGGSGGSLSTLYETSFEANEPLFEKTAGAGVFSNDPPTGTMARTGTKVITNTSMTTSYAGRQIQSVDCVALNNDTDPVHATIYGEASTGNGANVLTGRIRMLWFTNNGCTTPASTPSDTDSGVTLPQGSYAATTFQAAPPTGATHFKIRFEMHDASGSDEDDWAGDDVLVQQ